MRPCARFERGLSRRAGHTVSFHASCTDISRVQQVGMRETVRGFEQQGF